MGLITAMVLLWVFHISGDTVGPGEERGRPLTEWQALGPDVRPVTSVGDQIVLWSGDLDSGRYVLWHPAQPDDFQPLDLPYPHDLSLPLTGSLDGRWLLSWHSVEGARGDELRLMHLESGESRVVTDDAFSGARFTDRAVVWNTIDGGVHAVEIESGREHTFAQSWDEQGGLVCAAAHLACWSAVVDGIDYLIRLVDLETGEESTHPITGRLSGATVDSKGEYLLWTQDGTEPGYYVKPLSGDAPLRFWDDPGGPYPMEVHEHKGVVAWQPVFINRNARAGYYVLETGHLHLIEPTEGKRLAYGALLGRWYVWGEREDETSPIDYYIIDLE